MRKLFFTILFLNLTCHVYSNSITIPSDFVTIQKGIDAAVDGDSIVVLAGEYAENVEVREKSLYIIGKHGAGQTVINGQNGTGMYCQATSSYIVGFSFISCLWGMIIELQQEDSLVVENNRFINNSCGMLITSFSGRGPMIRGNWFQNNSPNSAIQNYDSSSKIYNNIFIENEAERGGAIFYVSAVITSYPEFVNNTLYKNSATIEGGGIYVGWDCHANIINNIIVGNNNGAVCAGPEGYPVFLYNDVWDNGVEDYINCIVGTNDISEDPAFESSVNYYLQSGSPCIDAGHPDRSYNDPDNSRNDMGATGGPYSNIIIMVKVSPSDDGSPEIPQFKLDRNYPNPFNSYTRLQIHIPLSGYVKADLYDIRGAEVIHLIDGILAAGQHSIELTSDTLYTGVYVVSVRYGAQIQTRKIMVLK